MSTRLERRQVNRTAAYTIQPPRDRAGTTFTNAGASGSVTFTLPTPGKGVHGWWYRFIAIAAQTIVVAAPVADTLIAHNDATADSVQSSTYGATLEAVCVQTANGYAWVVMGQGVSATYTVNT